MREFERRGRLAKLPLPARAIYTIFLLFTLLAIGVSAWLADQMVGLDLSRLGEYYAGIKPEAAVVPVASEGAGPTLDLPPEVTETGPEPKSLRATLEVTHFHLFTMPLEWLVLAHLFALCAWPERSKLVVIAASALAVVGHISAPWVARTGVSWGSAFYAVTGLLLAVTFVVMTLVPLFEMWGKPQN